MATINRKRKKLKKRTQAYEPQRYNTKTLHEEREYGFFWYDWLWRLLRPVLLFLCSALVVVGIVSTGYNKVYEKFLMPADPSDNEPVAFTIESGQSISSIGTSLERDGLLRNGKIFKYLVQLKGETNNISYGTYSLSPDMTISRIIDELSSGSQTNERTITVIPGWTCEDIAEYLYELGAITSKDEFLALLNDVDRFVDDSYALRLAQDAGALAGRRYALEGYLAPDTYRVFLSATGEDIINKLLAESNNVIDRVFYADNTQYFTDDEGNIIEVERYQSTLSIDETLVLASVIEKEAGRTEDYAKVSAVLHNRLNAGWRLESDPTATYLTGRDTLIVSEEELSDVNGYNTYQRDGLPVGPICNPSRAAVEAALYPDLEYVNAGYMYFSATEPTSGELVFAVTKEEHEANVAKYYDSWVAYEEEKANEE